MKINNENLECSNPGIFDAPCEKCYECLISNVYGENMEAYKKLKKSSNKLKSLQLKLNESILTAERGNLDLSQLETIFIQLKTTLFDLNKMFIN